jgi:predicted DNA-binding protein with PD1-like motif
MYAFKQFGSKYVLSIDNHQEISAVLAAFCREKDIRCGAVYGLGAINKATFRFLDPATKKYVDKTFEEQMEITNLTGNISRKDGEVYLHLHITASRRDYSCIGGHLLSAVLSGACELVVESFDGEIGRRFDSETGLNLYDL